MGGPHFPFGPPRGPRPLVEAIAPLRSLGPRCRADRCRPSAGRAAGRPCIRCIVNFKCVEVVSTVLLAILTVAVKPKLRAALATLHLDPNPWGPYPQHPHAVQRTRMWRGLGAQRRGEEDERGHIAASSFGSGSAGAVGVSLAGTFPACPVPVRLLEADWPPSAHDDISESTH